LNGIQEVTGSIPVSSTTQPLDEGLLLQFPLSTGIPPFAYLLPAAAAIFLPCYRDIMIPLSGKIQNKQAAAFLCRQLILLYSTTLYYII
jgi:hypothetical protein